MPGALTRVATKQGDVVSMQWGGSSKDTWVLAEKPVARAPLQRPRLGVADVARSVVDIASRVGENLFWMGRYAERCEDLARLLRAALVRVADAAPEEEPALASLAAVCERIGVFSAEEAKGAPPFVAAVVDPAMQGGLAANALRLHAAANQVRERMSTDNWHVLNRLYQRLPGAEATIGVALESLDDIMLVCVSLAGFAMDDMTRDESWHFLLLGRRIERLAHLAGLVAHVLALPPAAREASLEWLLEAANSIVTFRARYRRAPELLPVLHLVVADETNPHSVAFQLREIASTLDRIAMELEAGEALTGAVRSETALADALRDLSLAGFEPEAGDALESACADLSTFLGRVEHATFELSDDLQRRFFSHAGTPAPLGLAR
jgi:uncharacterized alpha-E superfamily protein